MRALIVDDDRTLADLLAFTMRREGFEALLAFDAPGAIQTFEKEQVDVIILDVNLPGQPGLRDGFDVCRSIRQVSPVPIILLTVRDDEPDIIKGLELGADDYVLKPFSPSELMARVKSVLRRSTHTLSQQDVQAFEYGPIKFFPTLYEVSVNDAPSEKLTRLEAKLLEYFMLNKGQILPAQNIIFHVWGPGGGSNEMLRQLVHRLRGKIEKTPGEPEIISNLPGIGYGFGI